MSRYEDVDEVYLEKIQPRLIKGTPTEDIRRWSVLAHSVMELTGPSPFGWDGNCELWLHERSLTCLLDMCDAIDEKFATLGAGECENISDSPEGFLCSECRWGDFAEPSHLLTSAKFSGRIHGGPNFCPNCGCKVVGE